MVVNTSKSGRGECSYDFGEGDGVAKRESNNTLILAIKSTTLLPLVSTNVRSSDAKFTTWGYTLHRFVTSTLSRVMGNAVNKRALGNKMIAKLCSCFRILLALFRESLMGSLYLEKGGRRFESGHPDQEVEKPLLLTAGELER